jgi:hypothetical protein
MEESVSGNKRNQSPPPAYGSDDDASYRQQFPSIDEMISSQLTQDSEDSGPPDPPAKSPANRSSKRQKRGTSNERARDPLCCPCSRVGTCSQRGGSCVCVQNRHACTNCDPLACGRCTNTHRARTGRIEEACLQRDRFLASLNAQPRSSQSQDEAESNATGANDPRTDTSGLDNRAPAAGSTTELSFEPSSANSNNAPLANVQGERVAAPPAEDARVNEQNQEEEDATVLQREAPIRLPMEPRPAAMQLKTKVETRKGTLMPVPTHAQQSLISLMTKMRRKRRPNTTTRIKTLDGMHVWRYQIMHLTMHTI